MSTVAVHEVGPRDGLQNEVVQVPTDVKIDLVNRLSEIGLAHIEVTSFVSPKWVPQLADASVVMESIQRLPGTCYSVLTPNMKGYAAARAARANEVAIFAAASETFSQRNINCSIAESLERFKPVVQAAKEDGVALRGYISCVANCPYEGAIAPEAVAVLSEQLLAMGCHEISVGDTTGTGTPEQIQAMLDAVIQRVPVDQLAGHYHDTDHRALDNVRVSLEAGVRSFDSAIGGAGGCPYSPGAKGNLSTLSLVQWLHDKGFETGIDMAGLQAADAFMREQVLPASRLSDA